MHEGKPMPSTEGLITGRGDHVNYTAASQAQVCSQGSPPLMKPPVRTSVNMTSVESLKSTSNAFPFYSPSLLSKLGTYRMASLCKAPVALLIVTPSPVSPFSSPPPGATVTRVSIQVLQQTEGLPLHTHPPGPLHMLPPPPLLEGPVLSTWLFLLFFRSQLGCCLPRERPFLPPCPRQQISLLLIPFLCPVWTHLQAPRRHVSSAKHSARPTVGTQ